ncbi:fimbrial biogenesis chaperone [Shewanella cutis]|uniref:Molecular chaperone n=1 Tax=Shewanella cutis TaxID=2766780 RepID=A0ABS9R0V9_9GAMM|nr:molecular chaperone [Shewanella sp. PS-2]MCG9966230.1 molecular chaperone [Shewanella sp. PS-2]
MIKVNLYIVFTRVLIFCFAIICIDTRASVVIDRTRIVFYDDQAEQTAFLNNDNDYPVIIQLWIDDGKIDSNPENTTAPLFVVPPMIKLAAGEVKNIRVMNNLENTNAYEELYWLNIYEIPQEYNSEITDLNSQVIVFTIRTQVKVFVRPRVLHSQEKVRFEKQYFSIADEALNVKNDSPFFIVYDRVLISDGSHEFEFFPETIAPYSSKEFDISIHEKAFNKNIATVTFDYIDDNGAINTIITKVGESKSPM